MSGIPDTVWPLDPHTAAKHDVLRRYLDAWFPILANVAPGINYIDGFAGPGRYRDGEDGSPVIAMDAALNRPKPIKGNVSFTFIEKDKDRADALKQVLPAKFPKLPEGWTYDVKNGEFESVTNRVLDQIEGDGHKLAPTFAFIDPFGYGEVPMETIKRILKFRSCEVLITFMAGFANRFTDESHAAAQTRLFGGETWRDVNNVTGADARADFLLRLYETQLRNVAGATFTRSFEMRDANGRILYYLVFGTKHYRGLEVMKDAMWSVDPRGTYRFSDRTDEKQVYLIDYQEDKNEHWASAAATAIHGKFRGRTASVEDVLMSVTVETPFRPRKVILKRAEEAGLVIAVSGRKRAGTFPEGSKITFAP